MAVVDIQRKPLSSFKDMEVYKKAYATSLSIQQITRGFPVEERYSLADQMRRCSRSICANLAEGFIKQKHSKPEFKRFVAMAEGSASEMLVWVDYCLDFGYINKTQHEQWVGEYITVAKMLNKLSGSLVR